jgi:Putative 2OG-Fe(II) oxygenase
VNEGLRTAESKVTEADSAGDQAALPSGIRLGDIELPVWPEGQSVDPMSAPLMAITTFKDWETYHPALIAAALEAEQDPQFRARFFRGGCGTKVRRIPQWRSTAAQLIHARALTLAHRTLSRRAVFADDNWGSVYRDGDHCMPHSHLRSDVSLVYMLDTGDVDMDDELAARLCFADPRIDACCPDEPGRVTRHVMPVMTPGTMLIFSSDYLHSVNPYYGKRPRITLSWNITLQRLPGRPGEGWM